MTTHALRRSSALGVALAVAAAGLAVPAASAAAADVPPLPRAYDVIDVATTPPVEGAVPVLALSADGSTVVHLRGTGEETPAELVSTPADGGDAAVVGRGPSGAPVPRVEQVEVSADGTRTAFHAVGSSPAELGLPAGTDEGLDEALFVHDRLTGATAWVPVPEDLGAPPSHLPLSGVALDAAGTRVAATVDLDALPAYASFTGAGGLLVGTLDAASGAGGPVAVHVVRPEQLLLEGETLDGTRPSARAVALSGDGTVLVALVETATGRRLQRLDAATGAGLPGTRALSPQAADAWLPSTDAAGRTVAVRTNDSGPQLAAVDLATGGQRDLPVLGTAPMDDGDRPFTSDERPSAVELTADGATVLSVRAGALWSQPADGSAGPVLVSSGLDGRIGEELPDEGLTYPDAVLSLGASADGATLAFLSASTAFVAPRTLPEPYAPGHVYLARPADAAPPAFPAGAELSVTAGPTSAALTWPAAPGAAGYVVTVDGVPRPQQAGTSTLVDGLAPGSTVALAVVAVDAAGRASAPLTATVVLPDDAPPGGAPLAAVGGPGARVALQWAAPATAGITGYRVVRDGSPLADVTETFYTDTAVAAATTYAYAVMALRGDEVLPLTATATVTTDALRLDDTRSALPRVGRTLTVAPGRPAGFALTGAPGFTASAALTVRAADGSATAVTVPLAEGPAGTYTGSWTVPTGVTDVLAGELRLADGVGTALNRPVAGLPAAVGGLLRLAVTAPGGDATGTRLQVWSDSTGTGTVLDLAADAVLDVPVLPATDHRITSRRADGLDATQPVSASVAPGQLVELAVAPYAPAQLALDVRRPGDRPLSDVEVVLQTRTGPRTTRTDAEGRARVDLLDAGTDVTAEVRVPPALRVDLGLAEPAPLTVTLTPGENRRVLEVPGRGEQQLSGTVTDSAGRPLVAQVVGRQVVDGEGRSWSASSAADGSWTMTVLAGAETVLQGRHATGSSPEATVAPGAAEPVELVVPAGTRYVVHPTVTTVTVDGDRRVQELDPLAAARYGVRVNAGGLSRFGASEVVVDVPPGTPVELCADGARSGFSAACASATTGDAVDIPLAVEIREAARVTGRVLDPDGSVRDGKTTVTLTGGGKTVRTQMSDGSLVVAVPSPGAWLLELTGSWFDGRDYHLARTVHVEEGDELRLGDLRLNDGNAGLVLRAEGSSFRAVRDDVLPGRVVELRAEVALRRASDASTLTVAVPEGIEVPATGAVLRDGVAVPYEVAGTGAERTLRVSLPPATSRTVRALLRAPADPGTTLPFTAAVTTPLGTEELGSALVDVGRLTLLAPSTSLDGDVRLTGRAPVGATVVVSGDEGTVVEAVAGTGGRWSARVKLEAGEDPLRHRLQATAVVTDGEGDDVALRSEPVVVVVDRYASVLEEVTVRAVGDGVPQLSYTFRPADGVARLPFWWVPTWDYVVTARFSGPVREPRAVLGATVTPMSPVAGADDVWTSSTKLAIPDVGDLTVVFDGMRERPALAVPAPPEADEVLVDPATVELSDPEQVGNAVRQAFSAPAPRLGPQAVLTGSLEVERLESYDPSPEDAARVAASGARVWATSFSATDPRAIDTTGRWSVVAGGIVDLAWLSSQPTPVGEQLRTLGFVSGVARIGFEAGFQVVSQGESIYSAVTSGGKWEALEKLQQMAWRCGDPNSATIYANAVDRLALRALQLDAFNAAAAVAGLALAPATFGLGTVAVWAVGWGLGKAMEFPLEADIAALEREINSDTECRRDDEDNPFPYRRPGDPHGQLDWGFDPSGFVYEGMASRRVPGVVATALRADAPDGPWSVWDADPWSQRNPLTTTSAGRYAWDVPEGWWKVRFAAEGWLPAESAAVEVLPPQTEVNVSLVRRELARVTEVTADAAGLVVRFDQPVLLSSAVPDRVRVTGPQGASLAGEWTSLDAEPAPVGHPAAGQALATALRFTAERYTGQALVEVDGLVRDHAGRALAEGVVRAVDVDWPGPDVVPPTVAVTGVADGARYTVGAVPVAACTTTDEGSGVATPSALTVTGGSSAGVGRYTATCAGAVDHAGNMATPVAVTYDVTYDVSPVLPPWGADRSREVEASSSVPLSFRVTDATGAGVTGLRAVTLTSRPCAGGAERPEAAGALTEAAPGSYRLSWRTTRDLRGSCRILRLDLGEGPGVQRTATFRFRAVS